MESTWCQLHGICGIQIVPCARVTLFYQYRHRSHRAEANLTDESALLKEVNHFQKGKAERGKNVR
jgi:hypothetical protein